jgi:hypothetical protein
LGVIFDICAFGIADDVVCRTLAATIMAALTGDTGFITTAAVHGIVLDIDTKGATFDQASRTHTSTFFAGLVGTASVVASTTVADISTGIDTSLWCIAPHRTAGATMSITTDLPNIAGMAALTAI